MSEPPCAAPPDWNSFRQQMPVAERWAYFDHAAVAPLPRPARDALIDWADQAMRQGDTVWPQWTHHAETTRQMAAKLIGADEAEIALVGNTTAGINLVAEGYPWQPGDNVVTLADEFPTNQYPWLNLAAKGVETRRIATERGRLDLAKLDQRCDRRTRIVSVSWINFANGYRHDVPAIAEVAHRRGALLLLDAIQGLGVFPIQARDWGVDFLAADGHKWLLGPEGAGILFIRREHLDRLRPLGLGWNSVVHGHDYQRIDLKLKPSAARYEGGSLNLAGFIALGASLRLLMDLGAEAIARRLLGLTDQAWQKLEAAGAQIVSHSEREHRSGILSFSLPGVDPMAFRKHCLSSGVVLSCRGGHLRIAPHGYNNEQDLNRLIDCIDQFGGSS